MIGYSKYIKKCLFVAIAAVMFSGFAYAPNSFAAEKIWRMGTSNTGTAGYACAMGLSSIVKKHGNGVKMEAIPTPGSTASVRLFAKKELDMAYQSGWGLAEIYYNLGPFSKTDLARKPYQGLYYAHFDLMLITKADRDDIKCFHDLEGKKVFPELASQGWHDLLRTTLNKMGIYKNIKDRQLSLMQAADALSMGTLDVVGAYATNGGAMSVSWIKNIDTLVDVKIISPSPEEQKEIAAMDLPGVFYGLPLEYTALTPKNKEHTEKANPNGVWLFGAFQGWHPGSDMPTEAMYNMYKAWMDNKEELGEVNAYLEYWAKDALAMQVKAIDAAKTIPVHPGVAKYLKEKGVWKDSWIIGKLDPGVE